MKKKQSVIEKQKNVLIPIWEMKIITQNPRVCPVLTKGVNYEIYRKSVNNLSKSDHGSKIKEYHKLAELLKKNEDSKYETIQK